MKHIFYTAADCPNKDCPEHENIPCPTCDHGLSICKVCGEAEVPECPGPSRPQCSGDVIRSGGPEIIKEIQDIVFTPLPPFLQGADHEVLRAQLSTALSDLSECQRELAAARQQIGSLLSLKDERDEWRLLAEQAEELVSDHHQGWHYDYERLLKLRPAKP